MIKTNKMPVFFHTAQLDFHPKYEWAFGHRIKHPETTRRAESIYREITKNKNLFEIIEPPQVSLKAIRDGHNYQLITLYNTAMALEEGRAYYPSVFPQRMKAKPDPTNLAHAGFYCFDSGTPLNSKTWSAASWSASSAYYAALYIEKQQGLHSYALSRPPGHHAARDAYGGYCYFNNAALAARRLRKKGRVAVIDIDFHHGNGTQEMFYRDDKVLTCSLHGDPRNYFPYFCGFSSEIGAGRGEGYNLNVVLKEKCTIKTYMKTLKDTVLPTVRRFEPDYLIVSAGFDTYELDPIGNFLLKTDDYQLLGETFKKLQLPTVIVQEGGYYTPHLGKNVVSFLKGFF